MLYAISFLLLFAIGGLTGLVPRRALATDVHLTDTYFVVAHFHYVMMGGTVIALHRRPALLVAEDDRPHVQRDLGAHRLRAGLHRLQHDVPAAVRAGQPRACRAAITTTSISSSRCTSFSTYGAGCWAPGCSSRGLICWLRWQAEGTRRQSLGRHDHGVGDLLAADLRITSKNSRCSSTTLRLPPPRTGAHGHEDLATVT